MAKKKAKRSASKQTGGRFEGLKLFFTGNTEQYGDKPAALKAWAREEGATVQAKPNNQTDLLIVLSRGKTASAVKQVEKLNKQGAAIGTLSESDYYDRFLPTAEEVVELIKSGTKGREKVANLLARSKALRNSAKIDLRGVDLRGCDLSDLEFYPVTLHGSDLREAKLGSFHVGVLENVRLDKASGQYFYVDSMRHCQCKGAQFPDLFLGSRSYGRQKNLFDCDFTGANLNDAYFNYSTIEKTSFKGADLSETDLHSCKFVDVDFSGADLTTANLSDSACTGSVSFARATLAGVNAKDTDFSGADLAKCDFSGAQLNGAKFTNAKLAGADFADAVVYGACFDGADVGKAKNLVAAPSGAAKAGKACRKLDATVNRAAQIQVEAAVVLPEGKEVWFQAMSGKFYYRTSAQYSVTGPNDDGISHSFAAKSLSEALARHAEMWSHGQLQFDSIKASSMKSPTKGKALTSLATEALCEVFDVEAPSVEEVQEKRKKTQQTKKAVQQEVLAELRGGAKGVRAFNKRDVAELAKIKFDCLRKEDLSGATLSSLSAAGFGFVECNLDGALLKKAKLRSCNLRKSTLRGAELAECDLRGSDLTGCDVTGAKAGKAKLSDARLDQANFADADLSGADLSGASLKGAQLEKAKLTRAKWRGNAFDEQTTFPAKFKIPDHFQFVGKGDDPRIAAEAPLEDVQDFEAFMKKLETSVDGSRLNKSLKMLKADSFQLFSDVSDEAIVGVVKSQTDKDLVYSCRLTSGGEFCCCTQNLNPCGGLRGALCKHLLVLLIGLTKGGALSPQSAATWARASGRRKPVLDKDPMAETLLKYKGAEAGDVDWRPTETVPEDYYAF